MKRIFALLLALCLILTACGESEPAEQELGNETETAIDPEVVMDNFLAKVDAANYVIQGADFLKTTVSSRDQVCFEYNDDRYHDFAVISVDNETFQAFLDDGMLGFAEYLGEGQAVDLAKSRLLNYWTDDSVSQRNIFNLFYNVVDEPLKFVSYEETVKRSVMSFVGYGESAVRLMHEVYLELDAENPTVAHIKAEMDEDLVARISYDDIDVTVTFGGAKSNAQADEWMAAPVYPGSKGGWDDPDYFIFNSVFITGSGVDVIPFPSFASYAMRMDDEAFMMNDEVSIRDPHATEQNVADYIKQLESEGFTEVTEETEDGSTETWYRRMLREEYKCYTSVQAWYDNGFNLTAKKYYDFPTFEGLDAVNEEITAYAYPELPESDNFSEVKATNRAAARTESWLYFFDYDQELYVDVRYEDEDALRTYLEEYGKDVENAGFNVYYLEDSDEVDRYESDNSFCSFRYHFNDDGTVTFLYRTQKYIPADQAEGMIRSAGFPAIDLEDPITCRDLKKFQKAQYGRDRIAYITLGLNFEKASDAEDFLNSYEEKLTAAGFERVNPESVGSMKNVAIYNEAKDILVGIDFYEQGEGALVNIDFSAG